MKKIKDIDYVTDVITLLSGEESYSRSMSNLLISGEAHLFMVFEGFLILRPIVKNDVATVRVEFAYSVNKKSFNNGFNFVCNRAKEIGARKVTFSTKNDKLARLAKKLGWTKTDEHDCLSNWEFTI